MAQRNQRGWLKKESRTHGETWVLFFRRTRISDGKRVENKIPTGLVKDLPDKSLVWAEVERLHLPLNQENSLRCVTFADLAQHYAEHELADHAESIHPKAHTTVRAYERVVRNRLLPRLGNRIALGIEPLEVEQWLVRAAGVPVTGRKRVATFIAAISTCCWKGVTLDWVETNGQAAVLILRDGVAIGLTIDASAQGINEIMWFLRPSKLAAISKSRQRLSDNTAGPAAA